MVGRAAKFAVAGISVANCRLAPAAKSTAVRSDSVVKHTAITDYHRNMAPFGGRISFPIGRLLNCPPRKTPWQFDVLVVGSGYGAAIMAARIANAKSKKCRLGVLERGREWIPGAFPDRLNEILGDSRLGLTGADRGRVCNPVGLYNVQRFNDVTVMTGSGLGGTSLINANVALRPDPDVFGQSVWPKELRSREYLEPYLELAEYELGVAKEPWDHTSKMKAHRMAAEYLAASGARFEPASLAITRGSVGMPIINRQGMLQRSCTDCGDCMTGCNVGAKNSLAQNYLPMARRAGAEFYTQVEVNRVERVRDYYKVHFTHFRPNNGGGMDACQGTTTTRVLVLGAGSIGSTEILLRSQSTNFQFSQRLGRGWTANGDALGFVRSTEANTGVGGFSAYLDHGTRVGPTSQANLTYPHRSLMGRVQIQDGTAARAYAKTLGLLLRDTDLSHVQILLGMGHDGANGCITLDEAGYGKVDWPGIHESPYRKMIHGEFNRVAHAMGGTYEYLRTFGKQPVSVHPLGGCALSASPDGGVVNHIGQVFDATYGGDIDPYTKELRVHPGLYVVDGSILPTSIGSSPLLTISALAERSADHLLNEPCLSDLFGSAYGHV